MPERPGLPGKPARPGSPFGPGGPVGPRGGLRQAPTARTTSKALTPAVTSETHPVLCFPLRVTTSYSSLSGDSSELTEWQYSRDSNRQGLLSIHVIAWTRVYNYGRGRGLLTGLARGPFPPCDEPVSFATELRPTELSTRMTRRRGAGRLHPPSPPPLPVVGAHRNSVRPEPVEGGPHPHQQPPPTRTPPTLTRPHCAHSGTPATLSPWDSQSLTATGTARVPSPTVPPA